MSDHGKTRHGRSMSKRLGLSMIKFIPFVNVSEKLKRGKEEKRRDKENEVREKISRGVKIIEDDVAIPPSIPLEEFLENDLDEQMRRILPQVTNIF